MSASNKTPVIFMNQSRLLLWAYASLLLLYSCRTQNSEHENEQFPSTEAIQPPAFNADSAYAFIERQVSFGPRVPSTRPHVVCGDYLVKKLESFDWKVIEQPFTPTTFDGKKLNARNIIGIFNPEARRRILLAAHWDSRPFADEDPHHKEKAVPAANDGASGVGVLLELARVLRADSGRLNLGVDIIFFDAEDWGNSGGSSPDDEYMGGFCLGSQHWARNKHIANYSAYYGILLDMVGAKDARFPREGISMEYAGDIVNKVWATGKALGYGSYFVDNTGLRVGVDDHVAINKIARIPMIDIIHLDPSTGSFFDHWHTTNDTMEHIDRETLKAVGQTLLHVLYQESVPAL